jgi:hypothetical protein
MVVHLSRPNRCLGIVAGVAFGVASGAELVYAADVKTECKAVQRMASVTRSSKLVLSLASDDAEKYCHFFVSLPPPNSTRLSVDKWFSVVANKLDLKEVSQIVSDIAVAAIPLDGAKLAQEVTFQIQGNTDLLGACLSALVKKEKFDRKSERGSVRCVVPESTDYLSLTVSVGTAFTSTITLPRPV